MIFIKKILGRVLDQVRDLACRTFLIASGVYRGDDALEDVFEDLHEKFTDSEEPAKQADDKLLTSDGRAQGCFSLQKNGPQFLEAPNV